MSYLVDAHSEGLSPAQRWCADPEYGFAIYLPHPLRKEEAHEPDDP